MLSLSFFLGPLLGHLAKKKPLDRETGREVNRVDAPTYAHQAAAFKRGRASC
jgi:hypothetical protein